MLIYLTQQILLLEFDLAIANFAKGLFRLHIYIRKQITKLSYNLYNLLTH